MKKTLKTGIATLGLGLLLGLGTPSIAQTPDNKDEEQQVISHKQAVYKDLTVLLIKTLENTDDTIRVKVTHEILVPYEGEIASTRYDEIVINGSKHNDKIRVDNVWRYGALRNTEIYEGQKISPALEITAKKILEQEAYKSEEEKDLSPLIYDLLMAFETEII
ncbi:MAG: hypothetical protein Q8N77_04075 [Nanoarchaeota archaeon]|nr:hypothetical protein [Nanoarchaeota archaeon]